jgi:hypothetical protein
MSLGLAMENKLLGRYFPQSLHDRLESQNSSPIPLLYPMYLFGNTRGNGLYSNSELSAL